MIDRNKLNILFGTMLLGIVLSSSSALAQGSIYGTVENSGGTTPAAEALSFYGFINDSDSELRLDDCIGAGYDVNEAGNWYDDFQNYQSEAPGMPYQYHFYNSDNNQGHILNDIIPPNSYQEAPVILETVSWPVTPTNVLSELNAQSQLVLHWDSTFGQTYHIYRREGSSSGSFFRIDNPGTVYTDGGVSDSSYTDTTGVAGETYSYIIIPVIGSTFGPRSEIFTFTVSTFLCGDVNNDGYVNVLDILEIIAYKFQGGPEPENLEAADADGDGFVNVLDILDLIDYKFKEGPEPTCGR